ncbi:hypothetical protein [Rhodobacter sp. 24-YEA-8]|uniref:hypothetical protein n=1 Tax=Rhodobacter sp. 24-YEA-8 TaxID=1884310 RepID=UPI000894F32A|nr:hypothetical protein [Rhodobacter sp. 24-YEA-8]SEC72464.1 hypothetical protein SAMN05519105_3155 [Rhodobacter sp. 24-YEA-8]
MSYAAGPARDAGHSPRSGPARSLADLALRLTTRRARDQAINLPPGYQLRLASPVWYEIWSRDAARLGRLGVAVLPEQIASLAADERQALVSDQLARSGAGAALPDWLKPALSRAKARLAMRLSWLD